MHEILNSFKQKPIPKFQQKLINFEKLQNFSKTPKPRFQNMKCMKTREKKLTKWREKLEKAWKTLGNEVWSERECFGRWEDKFVEREIEKNEKEITIRA